MMKRETIIQSQTLGELGRKELLVFGAACTERLLPNYTHFTQQLNWGNTVVLRQSLDLIWKHIEDSADIINISELKQEIDANTPNTEDFESELASFALDATTAVYELLNYFESSQLQSIIDISTVSFDTVDMFIQIKENLDPR